YCCTETLDVHELFVALIETRNSKAAVPKEHLLRFINSAQLDVRGLRGQGHILALSNLIPPPPPAYGRRTKGHYELLEQVMEERQKAHQAAIEVFNKLGRQQKVVFT
ncbi:Trafficking protein particle complex subunit 4, partial [Perkinsus olseni]